MWDKTWQPLIDEQKLVVLGVVQEQHAERTRLYKQWRQFKWPIVQDALNLLQVRVVPLVIAIDEQGRVVSHNANPDFVRSWLDGDQTNPDNNDWIPPSRDSMMTVRNQFLWHGESGLDQAISGYKQLLEDSTFQYRAQANFEVAVCYQNRFEETGNAVDFQNAIDHWSAGLEISPNHYIYRRRIQQYGARLGKPYPFYDWMQQAQTEILERGQDPVLLTVAISGAEIAHPMREFESLNSTIDWKSANRIDEDTADLIKINAITVPGIKAGLAIRVHVLVSPAENAKWNNEGDATALVIKPVEDATLSQTRLEIEPPDDAESSETRRFEFEVLLDKQVSKPITIHAAVLINLCIKDSGICIYLRKPVEITIQP